jgi:polysaccharide export outer membrane protein
MRSLPLLFVAVLLTGVASVDARGTGAAQARPGEAAQAAKPAATAAQKPAATAPQKPAGPAPAGVKAPPPELPAGVTPPPGFTIGPDDVLLVMFWREKDLSAEVAVRPDGKITLPLLNDVQAAGLTTDQLRERLMEAANKFVEDPSVTVAVKQINSRKVYITGQVGKPGTYPLTGPTTVLQLIAVAGGLADFAKKEDIVVMRTEGGKTMTFKFNYKDVTKGKKLEQNIELKPGDTVVVP